MAYNSGQNRKKFCNLNKSLYDFFTLNEWNKFDFKKQKQN